MSAEGELIIYEIMNGAQLRPQPSLHGCDMDLNSVPITIDLPLDEYEAQLSTGKLSLAGLVCPRCGLPE